MPGLVPGSYDFDMRKKKDVNGRCKRGHDDLKALACR
jgi:hypothetical protein